MCGNTEAEVGILDVKVEEGRGGARRLRVSESVDIRWYSCRVSGTNGNSTRDRLEMRK